MHCAIRLSGPRGATASNDEHGQKDVGGRVKPGHGDLSGVRSVAASWAGRLDVGEVADLGEAVERRERSGTRRLAAAGVAGYALLHPPYGDAGNGFTPRRG